MPGIVNDFLALPLQLSMFEIYHNELVCWDVKSGS